MEEKKNQEGAESQASEDKNNSVEGSGEDKPILVKPRRGRNDLVGNYSGKEIIIPSAGSITSSDTDIHNNEDMKLLNIIAAVLSSDEHRERGKSDDDSSSDSDSDDPNIIMFDSDDDDKDEEDVEQVDAEKEGGKARSNHQNNNNNNNNNNNKNNNNNDNKKSRSQD